MLDFQSSNELGRSVAKEYETAARRSGRPFLPIYLICDVNENLRRVTSPERGNTGAKKLLSCETLRDIRSRCELFSFDVPEGFRLNITYLSSAEAAARILAHIRWNSEE